MEQTHYCGWEKASSGQTRIERALAAGAVGGLIGLVFGPLGTAACCLVAGVIGFATARSDLSATAD
jgi:hypothetical protein